MLCAAAPLSGGLLIWRLTAHNQGSISPEFASAPTKNSKVGLRQKKETKQWAETHAALHANSTGTIKGMGPDKTLLAVALRDYAYDVMVLQKGLT